MVRKITGEAALYRQMAQRRLTSGGNPDGSRSFMRFLAAAIDRANAEKTVQKQPPIFSENLAAVESARYEPVVDKGDGFKKVLAVVLQHEGTKYVNRDGGEEPSKFGILQATARKYGYEGNVKNLSIIDAQSIYSRMWEESGASGLPYPLSLVHFDTYVNSPAAARKLLAKSGGNVDLYLKQRGQRYARLAQLRPERFAKYLKGWMNRVKSLQAITTEYRKAVNTVQNAHNMGLFLQDDGNLT